MNKSIFLWLSFTLIMVLGGINCHNLILDRNIDKLSPTGIVEHLVASVETIPARITCYKATGNKMANGQYPKNGFVATSDRTIPLGTEVIIEGKSYIVGDRTNKRIQEEFGILTVDIFMEEGCDLNYGASIKEIIINN